MKYLLILILLSSFSLRAEPVLDGIEMQISIVVDARQQQALALLDKAVNINSGTMNFAGVKKVGELFSEELKLLDFQVSWVEGASFNRAGHLLASRGDRGPRILLIGHLDTVFEPDSPFQEKEYQHRTKLHSVRASSHQNALLSTLHR